MTETKLENYLGSNRSERVWPAERMVLKARKRRWSFPGPTLIMGIVNLSPDSFSGDGIANDLPGLLGMVDAWMSQGVDMIDVGAVSTRPGAELLSEKEELARILPGLEALRKHVSIPISVDTTRAHVAYRALELGCDIVNDISGLRRDPEMASVVAAYSAGVIIMHSRGNPQTMASLTHYDDLIEDICHDLELSLAYARQAGIEDECIALDPGIGFAKDAVQNFDLLAHLRQFSRFGRPILVGPSRKSFIGSVTGREAGERVYGTAAACALAILGGAHILRVHDVAAMWDVARVSDEVLRRAGSGTRFASAEEIITLPN